MRDTEGINEILHLEQVYERLSRIEQKLDALNEYKTSSVTVAKSVSMIIGAVYCVTTMIAGNLILYFVSK